jgi:hypothetical protein
LGAGLLSIRANFLIRRAFFHATYEIHCAGEFK